MYLNDFLEKLSWAIAHGQEQASQAAVKRSMDLTGKLDIAGHEVHELQMHNPAPSHIEEFDLELKTLISKKDGQINIRFKRFGLPSFDSEATIRVKYMAGSPHETQSQIRDNLTASLPKIKPEE